MRLHLVVNPVAGRGRAGPLAAAVAAALRAGGVGVSLHATASAAEARAHLAGLGADAFDRLVLVGGDGTLSDALAARALPLPWPVGLLPMGTANVVARELGQPLRGAPEARAAALREAEPFEADLLELRRPGAPTSFAVANVGVGLDGAVVAAVHAARSRRAGQGGYGVWVAPILSAVARYRFPPLSVRVDGDRVYQAAAVVVQGAACYGGLFRLARGAALDAGRLHLSLVTGRTRRDLLRVLVRALAPGGVRDAGLLPLTAREVAVTAPEPVPCQADGDPAGATPLSVRLRPRAIRLLRRRPGASPA